METTQQNLLLKGIGVSPGIIIGKTFLFTSDDIEIPLITLCGKTEINREIERFRQALEKSRENLRAVKKEVERKKQKEARYIIDAQLLIMEDKLLVESIIKTIQERGIDAASAVNETIRNLSRSFDDVSDEYLKERKTDFDYIGERIIRNILGAKRHNLSTIHEPSIIVAHDLSPADTANLDTSVIIGFVTNTGGKTSHTAIMARALELPSVVGLKNVTKEVKNGDVIIVDGTIGVVIVRPTAETLRSYSEKKQMYEQLKKELFQYKDLPAETPDGYQIRLLANVELVEEVASILEHGAEGVGLYRTEFLYLNRKELPSEEEQFNIYRKVIKTIAPHPVTIRTLDLGGDKFLSHLDLVEELNPVLGLRAIRLCLKEVHIFRTQLRALLRASAFGELKMLFPMISGMQEIYQIKDILNEIKHDLRSAGIPFNPGVQIGIMIEIPSAATIADLLAREVDFFSIGTNDLIQYTLAVDRVNERITYLYEPTHPAILQLIYHVVEVARDHALWTSVCGEMAGDPVLAPLLLGLGVDELSMSPHLLPLVKGMIRRMDYRHLERLAADALQSESASAIMEQCRQLAQSAASDICDIIS